MKRIGLPLIKTALFLLFQPSLLCVVTFGIFLRSKMTFGILQSTYARMTGKPNCMKFQKFSTMSNQNMNWQQFLTEFVLRAMTNPDVAAISTDSEDQMLDWTIGLANKAWDAIQANQPPLAPDLKPSNSTELKQLAELAAAQGFSWIAQDKCRIWYGYKNEPEFREHLQEWRSGGSGHWAALNLPDNTDYSKQIFNVKTILDNEQ